LALRLQAKGAPDAADSRLRHTRFVSHRARAPVGRALGLGLQGLGDHGVHPRIVNGARRPRHGCVQQTIEPMFNKACPPLGHRLLGHVVAHHHRIVGLPRCAGVKSSKSENVLKFPICGKSTTYGDFLLACYRLARLHKSNKDGNIRHFVVMSKILC
jgi:hypothetical protein